MEPVTHFLTGACLGRSGFNRKTAYATLAMTLAAEAPDLDVFWSFGGPIAGFQHHRGITHTLIGAPFMALAVTTFVYGVHRLRRKPPAIPPRWLFLWFAALVADLSHLLLDYTNNYGLRPFFPFNPRWYAWDIVYIFDPILFAMLLAALVIPALLGVVDGEMTRRRTLFRGRGWAIAALIGVASLYALRNAEHAHAIALVRAAPPTREPLMRVAAMPYPLDPFVWHALLETRDAYQGATVRTRSDEIETDAYDNTIHKAPVTPAVVAAKQSYLGRVYLDWSSWPVTEDLGNVAAPGEPPLPPGYHTVVFRDMRFGYPVVSGSVGERSRGALAGYVTISPAGKVDASFMNGREQK
jgi:inner membrane protein